jgi:hypothetical protein
MATTGRPKRKRKAGAGSGVAVKPHVRSPRGPDAKGGKRKRPVIVDPYKRGKPKDKRTKVKKKPRKRKKK